MSFSPLYERISKSLGIPERKRVDITKFDYDERLDKREEISDSVIFSSKLPTLIHIDEMLLRFLKKIFLSDGIVPVFKNFDKKFSLSLLERNESGKVKLPVMLISRNEVQRLYDKIVGKIDPLMPQGEFVYYKPKNNSNNNNLIDEFIKKEYGGYVKNNVLMVDSNTGENSVKGYYVVFPEYVSINYTLECFSSTKEYMNGILEKFIYYDRYYITEKSYHIQYIGPDSYSIENELNIDEERVVRLNFNFTINCFVFFEKPRPLPVINTAEIDLKIT